MSNSFCKYIFLEYVESYKKINEVQDLEVAKHHPKMHIAGDRPTLT